MRTRRVGAALWLVAGFSVGCQSSGQQQSAYSNNPLLVSRQPLVQSPGRPTAAARPASGPTNYPVNYSVMAPPLPPAQSPVTPPPAIVNNAPPPAATQPGSAVALTKVTGEIPARTTREMMDQPTGLQPLPGMQLMPSLSQKASEPVPPQPGKVSPPPAALPPGISEPARPQAVLPAAVRPSNAEEHIQPVAVALPVLQNSAPDARTAVPPPPLPPIKTDLAQNAEVIPVAATTVPAQATGSAKYGNAPDYSWLRGELDRHYRGYLELRYRSLSDEDPHGGKVQLENSSQLAQFRAGDIVEVSGELVRDAAGGGLSSPRYHIRSIRLIER